jgi:hypothetical protein
MQNCIGAVWRMRSAGEPNAACSLKYLCTNQPLKTVPIDLGGTFWVDWSVSPPDDVLGDLPDLMPKVIARLTKTGVVASTVYLHQIGPP